MMELVDVTDSKSVDGNIVWVRVPLPAPVCFAQDQVFFSISNLPEEEQEEALTKIIIFLAGLVPVDHLKGLEQAAISKRAERLKEYKEYIEDLPEKDAKRILKELAILEKIRAQK